MFMDRVTKGLIDLKAGTEIENTKVETEKILNTMKNRKKTALIENSSV